MFVDTIDTDTAATMVEHLRASDAPMRVAWLRALGGRWPGCPPTPPPSRRTPQPDHGHRRRGLPGPRPGRGTPPVGHRPHRRPVPGDTGAYVGFIGEGSLTRVRDAYPQPTWQRLAEIKRRYDPSTRSTSTRTPHPRAWQGVDQPGKRPSTPQRGSETRLAFAQEVGVAASRGGAGGVVTVSRAVPLGSAVVCGVKGVET